MKTLAQALTKVVDSTHGVQKTYIAIEALDRDTTAWRYINTPADATENEIVIDGDGVTRTIELHAEMYGQVPATDFDAADGDIIGSEFYDYEEYAAYWNSFDNDYAKSFWELFEFSEEFAELEEKLSMMSVWSIPGFSDDHEKSDAAVAELFHDLENWADQLDEDDPSAPERLVIVQVENVIREADDNADVVKTAYEWRSKRPWEYVSAKKYVRHWLSCRALSRVATAPAIAERYNLTPNGVHKARIRGQLPGLETGGVWLYLWRDAEILWGG